MCSVSRTRRSGVPARVHVLEYVRTHEPEALATTGALHLCASRPTWSTPAKNHLRVAGLRRRASVSSGVRSQALAWAEMAIADRGVCAYR
jgi:hypothetical protein